MSLRTESSSKYGRSQKHHQNRMGLVRVSFVEEPTSEPQFIRRNSSGGRKQVTEEDSLAHSYVL
jgi:hypothetical protein